LAGLDAEAVRAASMNPSGSGLPRAICSTVITTFGAAIPAALMRAWASS
jgi:hypothetical protein